MFKVYDLKVAKPGVFGPVVNLVHYIDENSPFQGYTKEDIIKSGGNTIYILY